MYEHMTSSPVSFAQDVLVASMPTPRAEMTLVCFMGLAALLYHLPGPTATGPVTTKGHVPHYTDNGIAHMMLFTMVFVGGALFGLYPLSILYDELQPMIGTLDLGALLFCLFLYVKGRCWPSTSDVALSGHGFMYDFYAGIELYPRVCGFDVKKLVNSRFAMTFWMLFGISCVDASYRLHGELDIGLATNAFVTYLYLVHFFAWEMGYMRSIDIIEDNAGFMETWGCLVFVPSLYTNHLHSTVRSPTALTASEAALRGAFCVACLGLVYWADRQRQVFRETDGRSMLWWPVKPNSLTVRYQVTTMDGSKLTKDSLLLTNGFWGVVRHPQYIFELGVAYSWGFLSDPSVNGLRPFAYAIFLTILLLHRAQRDEARCLSKYKKGYAAYAAAVPYYMIPWVY